jgi:hypothetical protein
MSAANTKKKKTAKQPYRSKRAKSTGTTARKPGRKKKAGRPPTTVDKYAPPKGTDIALASHLEKDWYEMGSWEKKTAFAALFVGEAQGNATQALRLMGFKGKPSVLHSVGSRMLRSEPVQKAIKESFEGDPTIATSAERQRFWTGIMHGKIAGRKRVISIADRLKASELLGKSQGDFITRLGNADGTKIEVQQQIVIGQLAINF